MLNTNLVSAASPLVASFLAQWALVDTIQGGTTAMRAAGETYLPKEPKEKDVNYQARLKRSTFDNYYGEALNRAVDKVFSQDIQLKNQPGDITIWAQDVDQQGRDLTQFAKDVFHQGIHYGVDYILTDYPRLPDEGFANRAEELAANRRPYWVLIKAPQVLSADSQSFGGVEMLTSFRFQEEVYELQEDGITVKKFDQVRQFKQVGPRAPVEFTVWRAGTGVAGATGWVIVAQGILPVSRIPVAPFYGKRIGFFFGTPLMMPLAELNLAWWRKRSDLDNILHIANVPFLFGKGFGSETEMATGKKKGPIEVDIQQAVMASNPQADLKWVEHTGSNIKTAMEDLKNLEDRMREVGSSLFSQGGGFMTATEKAINAAEANANLKSLALGLKDTLELALVFVGEYLSSTPGEVEVNTSFATDYVAQETFGAVLTMYKAGLIMRDVVIAEAKRRNIIAMDGEYALPASPNIGKGADNEVIPPVEDGSGNRTVTV